MYYYSPCLRPQVEGDVSFSCPMKEGAVLCLPLQARGEDTIASADFGKWIIKHIDCWFAWARHLGVGVDRMEDIILVTGTHRTRSCTNVAFLGGQRDAQASFGAKVDRCGENVSINWKPSQNRGAVLNFGPDGEVRLFVICAGKRFLKYLSRDLFHTRTCRKISASSYEGFAPLVSSRYYHRGLGPRQDPVQNQRDTMRSPTRNSSQFLLCRR